MPTFEELIAEVLDTYKSRKALRTYKSTLANARHLIETFSGIRVQEISPDDFYSLHVKRCRIEDPNRNLNNDRKLFVRTLFIAYRRGIISVPPVKIPKPDLESTIGREITPTEINFLFSECRNQELKFQMEMALRTGMRKMELLHLRWEYVDLFRAIITLPPQVTKTRKGRAFPIARDLNVRLQTRRLRVPGEWVFPSKLKPGLPIENNRGAWERLLVKTGIRARWHDWRHTCASRKAKAKIPRGFIAKELGMSEKVLSSIYMHLDAEDLRESAESIALP